MVFKSQAKWKKQARGAVGRPDNFNIVLQFLLKTLRIASDFFPQYWQKIIPIFTLSQNKWKCDLRITICIADFMSFWPLHHVPDSYKIVFLGDITSICICFKEFPNETRGLLYDTEGARFQRYDNQAQQISKSGLTDTQSCSCVVRELLDFLWGPRHYSRLLWIDLVFPSPGVNQPRILFSWVQSWYTFN